MNRCFLGKSTLDYLNFPEETWRGLLLGLEFVLSYGRLWTERSLKLDLIIAIVVAIIISGVLMIIFLKGCEENEE